jgi:hypothetical protein
MTNKDEIKNVLTTTMLLTFKEENFKLSVKNVFKTELRTILVSNKEDFFQSEAYKKLEKTLSGKIKHFGNSSEFKNSLYTIFNKKLISIEKSNYTFSMLIPTTFINSLKVYVYNNKDTIATSIKTFLNSKKVQDKIKNEITKAIGTLNPMVSKFFSGDKIYNTINTGINSYFDNQENLMDMVMMINGILDKLMQKKVSDFLAHLPVEGKSSLINAFCNVIINNLFSDETISKVMISMKEKLNDEAFIKNLINTNQKVFDTLLDDLFDKYYGRILESNKLKAVIDNISDTLVDKLLEMPLKEFI